jgi:hypothetical protein
MGGELAVYIITDPHYKKARQEPRPPKQTEPLALPLNLVRQLSTNARGILADHAIRPTLKTAEHDPKLFRLLSVGLLLIRESDFNDWYRSERGTGKWPSQRSRSKHGNGRPTKQTEAIGNKVLALVDSGAWSAKQSIAKLHRLLKGDHPDVPSPDTLARLVDQLHDETGDSTLLRTRRAQRNQV